MISTTHPQWIAKMYPSKPGRDHLGLGSVSSDQILPTLSPSINVLTFHPRYYSFYIFLLDEFWQRDRPRTYGAWKAFFRPREFIFSVGAYLPGHREDRPEHGEMSNIVGGRKTAPKAAEQQDVYDTAAGADSYIVSPLGGYGLYYRTVMGELELIYPGGRGLPYPVDVPSEKGQEVAAAFRETIEDTTYYRDYFDDDAARVPIAVLRKYINRACLCQLQHRLAPDRALLRDIFLHGGAPAAAAARRATFRFFLDLAQETQGCAVDEDAFRQLLYFKAADNGATYTPSDTIIETYRRWRLYQAREYFAFALNALWDYLCDWGIRRHGDVRPLSLDRFWTHLQDALDFTGLAEMFSLRPPHLHGGSGFQQLLDWLRQIAGTGDPASFDTAWAVAMPLHEHHLYRRAQENRTRPQVMVAGMVVVLALIYLRFGRPDVWEEPAWEISRLGHNGRLPLDAFMKDLRRRLQSGPVTILEIARWLYRDYVILQHQIIATHKLPDNTFRFRREGDRLRFYNLSNSLNFMNSRFDALSTMIHELGLCTDLSRPDHPLTEDGLYLLREGDLP